MILQNPSTNVQYISNTLFQNNCTIPPYTLFQINSTKFVSVIVCMALHSC